MRLSWGFQYVGGQKRRLLQNIWLWFNRGRWCKAQGCWDVTIPSANSVLGLIIFVIYVTVCGQESVPQIKMSVKYFDSKSREFIPFIILKYFLALIIDNHGRYLDCWDLSLNSCRSILKRSGLSFFFSWLEYKRTNQQALRRKMWVLWGGVQV